MPKVCDTRKPIADSGDRPKGLHRRNRPAGARRQLVASASMPPQSSTSQPGPIPSISENLSMSEDQDLPEQGGSRYRVLSRKRPVPCRRGPTDRSDRLDKAVLAVMPAAPDPFEKCRLLDNLSRRLRKQCQAISRLMTQFTIVSLAIPQMPGLPVENECPKGDFGRFHDFSFLARQFTF